MKTISNTKNMNNQEDHHNHKVFQISKTGRTDRI